MSAYLTTDGQIAYTDSGKGNQAILLIHGSLSAHWFVPTSELLAERGYRVILMHRAGYGHSRSRSEAMSVVDYAQQCDEVLTACDVARAHVVGHSSGADIALQLAFDHPSLVGSLILFEPAFPFAPSEPANTSAPLAAQAARRGDYDEAFEIFLSGACGPGFRKTFMEQLAEDGVQEAIDSAPYFFTTEAQAFRSWSCDSQRLERISVPVLLVVGGRGLRLGTPHLARSAALAEQMHTAQMTVLPDVTHAMPLENPRLVTDTIADFVAAHPVT